MTPYPKIIRGTASSSARLRGEMQGCGGTEEAVLGFGHGSGDGPQAVGIFGTGCAVGEGTSPEPAPVQHIAPHSTTEGMFPSHPACTRSRSLLPCTCRRERSDRTWLVLS